MRQGGEFATTVSSRGDILAALVGDPATKPELVERVDSSRSTVDRAIDDLESRQLVTEDDGVYEATIVGVQTHEEYQAYLDRLGGLADAASVLEPLPPDAPLEPSALAGAEVETTPAHAPEQVLRQNVRIVEEATKIRGIGPAVFGGYIDAFVETAERNDCEFELILRPEVLEAARNVYSAAWRELTEVATLDLYVIEEPIPYELWHAETLDGPVAGLTVYTDSGIHGSVVNDTEAMRTWTTEQLEQYRERARAVAPGNVEEF